MRLLSTRLVPITTYLPAGLNEMNSRSTIYNILKSNTLVGDCDLHA